VLDLLTDALAPLGGHGFLLDGFSRTLAQAERGFARAVLAGHPANVVVNLVVSDDEARQRLAGRADAGRADDADPEVIERRLQVFHAETEPLLKFYDLRGVLVSVDATGSPDEVSRTMIAAVSSALASGGST